MSLVDINCKMDALKAEVHKLSAMKNLLAKNEMYKNDEKFREEKKKKAIEYYYRVVKPRKIKAIENSQENLEKSQEEIDVQKN
jgi:hypothetical protein